MKVIFLDIDGVLVTEKFMRQMLVENKEYSDSHGPMFDPDAVQNLMQIVTETGSKVVISSTWRLFGGLSAMRTIFKDRNIEVDIIGVTPSTNHFENRGQEIEAFLRKNKTIQEHVIIDDDDDMLQSQLQILVQTNPSTGLTIDKAQQAIAILGISK